MRNPTLLFYLAFTFINFSVIRAQSDMKLSDFSQGFVLTGRIVDKETNLGVPFAYVMIYKTDKGTLSDSLGNFRLDIPSVFSTHQLLISSVGFRDTIVAMPTNMSEIKIIPKVVQLGPVVVFNKPVKEINIGCRRNNFIVNPLRVSYNFGGFRVYFPYSRSANINSVAVNISEIKGKDLLINLRILKPDTSLRTYGNDLIGENIVVRPTKTGWIKIDVSKYNIKIPSSGFIVNIAVVGNRIESRSLKEARKDPHISFNFTSEKVNYIWMSASIYDEHPLMGHRPAVKVYVQE